MDWNDFADDFSLIKNVYSEHFFMYNNINLQRVFNCWLSLVLQEDELDQMEV